MSIFKNNIVIGIIALIILSSVGAYYMTREPEDNSLLTSQTVNNDGAGRELLASLMELRSMKFQSDIFNDPAFTVLKDFSREIPDEPKGRPNPFAPVGRDAGAVGTSTVSTATSTSR